MRRVRKPERRHLDADLQQMHHRKPITLHVQEPVQEPEQSPLQFPEQEPLQLPVQLPAQPDLQLAKYENLSSSANSTPVPYPRAWSASLERAEILLKSSADKTKLVFIDPPYGYPNLSGLAY
jgi:hypothetical protein